MLGTEMSEEGLTALALRAREHRIALHIDLSDLEPDVRIRKAAAFFAGLVLAPRSVWPNTVLVCVDEAHLLAPHMAASARDAEVRKLGVATLTDVCARGRKRGVGTILATQRLAKLASSVASEMQNALIGLNVYDRDVKRAADMLGFDSRQAEWLRKLHPGEFYAFGPALSTTAVLIRVDETITEHTGSTPTLIGAADLDGDERRRMLDMDGLREVAPARAVVQVGRGSRILDSFLLDDAAAAAAQIIATLRRITPNATTTRELAGHLGIKAETTNAGLDLLSMVGAVDTTPRGGERVARLSARLRAKACDVAVVGLA